MQMIERPQFLKKLIDFKDKQLIKVVTGVRRCGKSTLLHQFQNYLISTGCEKSQIIHVNFEDIDNQYLLDYKVLYSYIKERLHPTQKTYVFFDEIQQVEEFPKVIDSLYIKPNVDLYVTGSNANMLSSEIATLIAGRYVEITLQPLSFKEYVGAHQGLLELSRLYVDFVQYGSFPYVLFLGKNRGLISDYLQGLLNTVVLKDIISRKRFSDSMMLDSVIRFVFDNIGNPQSSKKIADTMTSFGRKIDVKTVEKYLSALVESFVVYHAPRYDIKGKQQLKTLGKYYVVDMGLRAILLGSRNYDRGRVLENVVYLELLRRYKQVYVGKCDNLEVDFVCVEPSGITYYQVAETVMDMQTLERELRPLKSIRDSYPKYLLTLDTDPVMDFDGIKKINVLDWLIE